MYLTLNNKQITLTLLCKKKNCFYQNRTEYLKIIPIYSLRINPM